MIEYVKLFISPEDSLKKSIQIIAQGAVQIALVVDENRRLLGTLTDGDIREGLLAGKTLESAVEAVMQREFRSLPMESTEDEAMQLMKSERLHQIPVLDAQGRVVHLFLLDEILKPARRPNRVVIMAGGEGRRLLPRTKNCPKPMLPVAGKPILEIIVEQCAAVGLHDIFIAVNYLKERIEDYFQDGSQLGVDIQYLREKQPLGTAGALSLLPKGDQPVLVVNGDVLTRVDFSRLLQFHEESETIATICVHEHRNQIPYGVVRTTDNQVLALEEKPVIKHRINAGIYVLSPEVIDMLPKGKSCDMTRLMETCLKEGRPVSAFLIHEFWSDIGFHESHDRAGKEWGK